jgi:Cu+-exporting ATPase
MEANDTQREAIFPVGGMSCASCAARVQKSLAALSGVRFAEVNFATGRATVRYSPGAARLSELKEAVAKAGYSVPEAIGASAKAADEHKAKELSSMGLRLAVSAFFAIPLFYSGMAPMLGLPYPAALEPMAMPLAYALFQLALTLPVIAANASVYSRGFAALLKRAPTMDSLIATGTLAAFSYSLYSTAMIASGDFRAVEHLYYETAGLILTLILLGKNLEARTKARASKAIDALLRLAPDKALIVRDGFEAEIPVAEVEPGDILRARPGERIAVDGVVVSGSSAVDESMLSGESLPVDKEGGARLYAGSLNVSGVLDYRASAVGADTALARIIALVERAQTGKPPLARLADRISGYFVPWVIAFSVLVFAAWMLAGRGFEFSLTSAVAVLVIACPCALGLATPAAVMAGTGRGASMGILYKSGEAIEAARGIDTVAFDKTGTLTEGRPSLAALVAAPGASREELLSVLGPLERRSTHPLAKPIAEAAGDLPDIALDGFASQGGKGLVARGPDGSRLAAGSARLMEEEGVDLGALSGEASAWAAKGASLVYAAKGGKALGFAALLDRPKAGTDRAVGALKAAGMRVVLVSGDKAEAARAVASELGIDEVLAEVLPEQKEDAVRGLMGSGAGRRRVAMVGDGINDAPALAAADLGIAIGRGADVAVESADVVLMGGEVDGVGKALALGSKTIKVMRQNLFWAFAYNVIGIPVAAGALTIFGGPGLSPVLAALAMALSSVSVITNALRLTRARL